MNEHEKPSLIDRLKSEELMEIFRTAQLRADKKLSRFNPMPRIISFDDFENDFCGWSQLVGNYEQSLDTMHPGYAQHLSPMLSTLPHWDAGSHGAMTSGHALKIATRAKPGAQNVAITRQTFRKLGPIRFEAYIAFKPEASELQLSETDVRSFGFLFDLQSGDTTSGGSRVMPHLRFLNAKDGTHHQKWQFKRQTTVRPIANSTKTITHYHLSPDDWEDLPNGHQRLCYNEIPTKVNWHYICFDFDLASMNAISFSCNDRVFDLSEFESIRLPAMNNLWCMLNTCLFVETDTNKRAFIYVDSACLSGAF